MHMKSMVFYLRSLALSNIASFIIREIKVHENNAILFRIKKIYNILKYKLKKNIFHTRLKVHVNVRFSVFVSFFKFAIDHFYSRQVNRSMTHSSLLHVDSQQYPAITL